jgi:predicted ABC-type ATPase
MVKPTGKPKPKKPEATDEPPDVEIGDEVYFRHPRGPLAGRVVSRGQHGCHVDVKNRRHKVLYENMLGNKVRLRPEYTVVDQGEDGMIAQEPSGRRRYIQDPDVPQETEVRKAMPQFLIFGDGDVLMKAIKNGPGLSLQSVTDKSGTQTKRWKKNSKDAPKDKPGAKPAEAGAAAGYGTHDIGRGDTVTFDAGDFKGKGTVVGKPGKQGAHVKDSAGRLHTVHWHEITKFEPKGGKKKPAAAQPGGAGTPRVLGEQKPIPADKFNAVDYAKSHDDSSVTDESILSQFPYDTRQKIEDANARLKELEETIATHKTGDDYSPERAALHKKIINSFFTPEKIAAAVPVDGAAPVLTVLGGRGGSGKGQLKGLAYDPDKAVVIDPDKIKKLLPEYEGWNAAQVHEEASDIMDEVMEVARAEKLNLVVDATMKTADTALERVKTFKAAGYKVDVPYMHLPRQEAAKRAVNRFLGKEQRYVPTHVILGNKTNEDSFEKVRKHADSWSFWDNNVPQGKKPLLISHSGKSATTGNEPGGDNVGALQSPRDGDK